MLRTVAALAVCLVGPACVDVLPDDASSVTRAAGHKWRIVPDPDPLVDDGPAWRAVLAAAQPGDDIVLAAGVHKLGATVSVSIPVPGGEVDSAAALFGPAYDVTGSGNLPPIGYYLVDKPGLRFRGERAVDGSLATVVTSLSARFDMQSCPLNDLNCLGALAAASQWVLLINAAADIEYREIHFDNGAAPAWAGAASGGAVTGCVLEDQQGNPRYYIDDRAADPSRPFRFKDNQWSGINGPHIDADAVICGNSFDSVLFGLFISAHAIVDTVAGLHSRFNEVANVTVCDNVFRGGPMREAVTVAGGFWGGEVRNVTMRGNVVTRTLHGVRVDGLNVQGIHPSTVEGIAIYDNHIEYTNGVGIDVNGSQGTVVKNNVVVGNGAGFGIRVRGSVGATATELLVVTAQGTVVTGNVVDATARGLDLQAGTRGCTVAGNLLLANGTDVFVSAAVPSAPGLLRAPVSGCDIAVASADVVDNRFPTCTNVASCPDLDDDGDGRSGEDPVDEGDRELNRDGDTHTLGGITRQLIDEDSLQQPNTLRVVD
jgi:hypothetical protein